MRSIAGLLLYTVALSAQPIEQQIKHFPLEVHTSLYESVPAAVTASVTFPGIQDLAGTAQQTFGVWISIDAHDIDPALSSFHISGEVLLESGVSVSINEDIPRDRKATFTTKLFGGL